MSTFEMHRPDTRSEGAEPAQPPRRSRPSRFSHIDQFGTPLRVDMGPQRWLQLEAETANVPVARRYVRQALAQLLPHDRLDDRFVLNLAADLELAASELVTNAVEHSAGQTLELTLSCTGRTVALEVVSHGRTDRVGPAREWHVSDVESVTGRGLGIVRAVSDRVTVARHGDDLTIRIEFDLPL